MINKNGGQAITSDEVTFTGRKKLIRKVDITKRRYSFLFIEEILRKRCLRSMDDEIEIAGGTTLAMFLAGIK